jgi:hypothetical protein
MAYTSRVPLVVDALVNAGRAFTGHRAPTAATSGVPVFDGPEYGITSDRAVTWAAVGWSGMPGAAEDAGDAGQRTAALGDRKREERGGVRLRICSQIGDRKADMKVVRDFAFDEFALWENYVRTTPRLGLSPQWMQHAEIARDYTWRQEINAGPIVTINAYVVFVTSI